MNSARAVSMNELYATLVEQVERDGETLVTRGFKCVELRPFQVRFTDATKTLYTGKSRKMNYRFFAIETLLYLCGEISPQLCSLLVRSNPGMHAFLNPHTGMFDGAYGPRLGQSYGRIIEQLKRDPYSRQCVASIWSPTTAQEKSLDVPCTVALQFMFSHGKLDGLGYMRSNDLNWGFPYDVPAFCAILNSIAKYVGMETGEYTHVAGSLHYYDSTVKGSPCKPELLDMGSEEFMNYQMPKWHSNYSDWAALSNQTRYLLEDTARFFDKNPDARWKDLPAYQLGLDGTLHPWFNIIRNGKPDEATV